MIILLLLILFCPLAHADFEQYAIELDDSSIEIENMDPTASISDVLKARGVVPKSITKVSAADLPPTKADRKYWKKSGNKVVVDTDRKTQDQADAQAKEARKKSLLKMTDAEYQEAQELGLVR